MRPDMDAAVGVMRQLIIGTLTNWRHPISGGPRCEFKGWRMSRTNPKRKPIASASEGRGATSGKWMRQGRRS